MSFLLGILLSASMVSCEKSEALLTLYNNVISIEVSKLINSNAAETSKTQTQPAGKYKKTIVSTLSALTSALNDAAPNDTVYVDDKAKINITSSLSLPRGVKLYSGRGENGAIGGLVYTTDLGLTMFKTTGSDVRVSGLRIKGPSTTTTPVTINYSNIGILVNKENVLIDNVEVFGFPYAGIKVQHTKTCHITKSYIHHNQRSGLGYGIVLDKGFALIDYNYFDYNRHAIAGGGASGTSFEAAFNTVLPHATEHSFDMHGSEGDYKGVGGTSINIHDNTFYMGKYRAITIRATPEKELIIKNNKFVHTSESAAILLFPSGTWGIKNISGNTYKIPTISIFKVGPKTM
ncbi:right-handed parallel beta-helix repeat-containing protein [Solitalea koreensis]|uniref:Right handed beta helix region n=1 Tax=Solitalea koreensis TaxID=543615 RepID=A0A521AMG4_9SPHI|nr:right-handed parallel beta-helix repeat-containing protein [Solitalea koreensis]SMO36018.1 Right handed beta helix region [Solitalea koreensis]